MNMFPGCKCVRGDCRTNSCPCFVAHRECDPDICRCGAEASSYPPPNHMIRALPKSDRLKLLKDGKMRFCNCEANECERVAHNCAPGDDTCRSTKHFVPCQNVNLAMCKHARIGVARSTVHGWGAFVLDDVKKGHLIYEYCGEMISQDEADRRGKICSFKKKIISIFFLIFFTFFKFFSFKKKIISNFFLIFFTF